MDKTDHELEATLFVPSSESHWSMQNLLRRSACRPFGKCARGEAPLAAVSRHQRPANVIGSPERNERLIVELLFPLFYDRFGVFQLFGREQFPQLISPCCHRFLLFRKFDSVK